MFQELQHGFDSTEMLPKSGDGPTMTFSPVKTSTDLDLRSSLGTADIILEAETLPGRPAGLGGVVFVSTHSALLRGQKPYRSKKSCSVPRKKFFPALAWVVPETVSVQSRMSCKTPLLHNV